MQHLKADLDETSAALRTPANALHAAESKLPAARAKVARVHGQLVAAQARDRLLGEQLQVAKAEVARAQGQIDDTLASIMASHKLIGRIARSSYQDGGMGELAVVLQSQSPDEFATRLVLVQNAMRSEGNVLSGLAESAGRPGGPAGHPGRQAPAGGRDEAPAGGAGREDHRPAGPGDRRAARRSSR